MIRTQVQIPDELYERAKRFSREREMSLAEVVRRGLEQLLDRYPPKDPPGTRWVLPTVDCGEMLVPLEDLRALAHEEEAFRSLRHEGERRSGTLVRHERLVPCGAAPEPPA